MAYIYTKDEIVRLVTNLLCELRMLCEEKRIPMLCVMLPTFRATSPVMPEEHNPEEYYWDATCEDSKDTPKEIRELYSSFKANLSGCMRSPGFSYGFSFWKNWNKWTSIADIDSELLEEQEEQRNPEEKTHFSFSPTRRIQITESICKRYKIPLFVALYDSRTQDMHYGYVSPMDCNGCELANDRFAQMLGSILIHDSNYKRPSVRKPRTKIPNK